MSTLISSNSPDKLPNPFQAYVWQDTNRVTSDAQVREIFLEGLSPDAKEAVGKWAAVDGRTKLGGVFKWDPFTSVSLPPLPRNLSYEPWKNDYIGAIAGSQAYKPPKGGYPTNDGFDQVQLYNSLTSLQLYLVGLGFDIGGIISSRRGGKSHAVVAHANKVDDLNAWYSPQAGDLTFGTSGGKWHLAADDDVSNHEYGHLLLDSINKGLSGWYSGEGGAIHEGFGDAMAAFRADDPEISEDFPPAMGESPDKGQGLRTVDNKLRLSDVSNEVHDRGQVYGAFWWSIKKKMQSRFGMSGREASDLALKIMVNHASFYKTTKPKPADFVKAVVAGARALEEGGVKLGVPVEDIKRIIADEAIYRGMIKKVSEAEARTRKKKSFLYDKAIIGAMQELGPKYSFRKGGASTATGGSREEFEQWYVTSGGEAARVIGGGYFIHRDASGKVDDVSKEDIRIFKAGEVIEERKIDISDALRIVQGKATRELMRAKAHKAAIEKMAVKTAEDREKIKYMQMDYRMALAATEKVAKLGRESGRMVILPGEKEISYEFKMGLSLYYVNSRTGQVRIESDVLWD